MWESLFVIKKWSQSFHLCVWRNCRGCGLGELVGSCVLFLWEQVKDFRVQEFLRELVVGAAAPRNLAGSVYSENSSLWWRRGHKASGSNLEIILLCLRLLISLSLVFISCMLIIFELIYYMLDIACVSQIYLLEFVYLSCMLVSLV